MLATSSDDSSSALPASGSPGELTKRAGSLSLGASSPIRSMSMGPNTPSRSLLLNKGAGMGGRGRGLSLSIDASMQVLRQALLFKSAMLKQRQQLSRARQNQEFLQTIGKRSAPAAAVNNH
ncbi:Corticotropin-releasing factor [Trinorchestia longiramus]|nr:Corticotropin-releasing factor [Trinorchestia longiramus]